MSLTGGVTIMKKDKTEADIIKDFFEEYLKDYLDKNCITYG